jgi:hypothetical protein
MRTRFSPRCLFVALISAWFVAVFVPSAVIALCGLSPLAVGHGFLAATWRVADEVAPFAKIGYAAAFLALLVLARRIPLDRQWDIPIDMVLACLAMLLVLAFLPRTWSRGFGIGLTGTRFSPLPTFIYFVGAVLSGLTFALSEQKCCERTEQKRPTMADSG